MKVPLAKPEILESDIDAVTAVLRSSRLSQGPVMRKFEEKLAEYLGVSHAVAVNSGTSALQLALRALNIQDGDQVILPSFSFMAVANAVLAARAIPVFVDIAPGSWNIDPEKIECMLSPRTRAIIVVHTFGFPAEMERILAIAKRHGIYVIEDACEALGAERNGHKAGTRGDVGIFAFYPNKQITTGEGGALTTNSSAIAGHVTRLRNQGRESSVEWLQHTEIGYSYRLSDINCALGLEQLSRLEDILRRREWLAHFYQRVLTPIADLQTYSDCPEGRISWFTYPVLLPGIERAGDRDEIWQELNQMGIETARYFAPAHLQPAMQSSAICCGDLSETRSVAQSVLCLPFFNSLQEEEIEFVCKSLHAVLAKRALTISA